MDVLAHSLWAGAVARGANVRLKRRVSVWQSAWWGVFPDLFAFTIPMGWLFWNLAFGDLSLADVPRPEAGEPPAESMFPIFRLAPALYNWSHSIFIFALVFLLVWLVRRMYFGHTHAEKSGPYWPLLAWLLHILIDIPTHTYEFYPTPIFWPLSDTKFSGISWGVPWFMFLNYASLLIVFIVLRRVERRREKSKG